MKQLASVIVIHPNSKLDIEVNASDSQKLVVTPTLLDKKRKDSSKYISLDGTLVAGMETVLPLNYSR